MIHEFLILTTSGLLLFHKRYRETHESLGSNLIGSLLATIVDSSARSVGNPVSYIELSNHAISLFFFRKRKIFCAVFHTAAQGHVFGQLVAQRICRVFCTNFESHNLESLHQVNLNDFLTFEEYLGDVYRSCIPVALERLERARGVSMVLLVRGDDVISGKRKIDSHGVVGNLKALFSFAGDSFQGMKDSPVEMRLLFDKDWVEVLSFQVDEMGTNHPFLVVTARKPSSNNEKKLTRHLNRFRTNCLMAERLVSQILRLQELA